MGEKKGRLVETDKQAKDLDISSIAPGDRVDLVWIVEDAEIEDFAQISGDFNPLHVDAAYAREQGFAGPVAHGMLLGAKLSALVGMALPGRRCLLLEQGLSFAKPVLAGDAITIVAEVSQVQAELRVVALSVKAMRPKASDAGVETVARGKLLCRLLP